MGVTSIEWTDRSWNPVRGCSRISPGCGGGTDGPNKGGCYAERMAARFCGPGLPYEGLVRIGKHGPQWTGVVRLVREHLEDPLKWRKPQRVFVNSMSDLFHEGLSDQDITNVFCVMEGSRYRGHRFQVLTKRAPRMRTFVNTWASKIDYADDFGRGYLGRYDHVWLGVSVEDRRRALERIPELQNTCARIRFLSVEPQLEDVGLLPLEGISWVICGAESGPGARPFKLDWARSLRDQCVKAGVAFFFKQDAVNGRAISTPELDGRTWTEFPEAGP